MKKTYLFLILETILNMLTGNLSAIIIIPLFVIGVDLLIRLFIKNDSLAKGLDKFFSSIFPVQAITMFKIICIIPKVVSVISLIAFSAFLNYMFFTWTIATGLFVLNIIVNIFTVRSCIKLYRCEKNEYIEKVQKNEVEKSISTSSESNSALNGKVESNPSKVTFIQGWKSFWKNYFNFKDTTDLKTFLWGALIYFVFKVITRSVLIYLVIMEVAHLNLYTIIIEIISIIILIPTLALNVRRLRDTGLTDGLNYTLNILYVLLGAIPVLSTIYKIIICVYLCMPTKKFSTNQ